MNFHVMILSLLLPVMMLGQGTLFIIGGGKRPPEMIKQIVSLAGGEKGHIIIIPNASGAPEEVGEYQKNQFLEAGIGECEALLLDSALVNDVAISKKIVAASGIFFSGGDQRRLTKLMNGSKALEAVWECYHNGGLISGTSAGAAVMSEKMITGTELLTKEDDEPFSSIRENNIELTEGFGFVNEAIIDQHFVARKRHNRLISVVLEHLELIGIGIDEATAIIVNSKRELTVSGEGSVIIYDARKAKNIQADARGFLSGSEMKLHILTDGMGFNMKKGKVLR
jgi:cyanophycinase